ncbi:MAG: class I SAM-dependent methyltransferase [Bacteroidetes bacterium]|nr:MAG: class I SAM-dependent methyltransferase [Bacteroidota bacterium]
MKNNFKKIFKIEGNINIVDELPLWSAPFGLKLLDIIKMKPGMNVLDIGSGLGFPAIEIAMRLGESCKIWGVEPWKEARDRAKEKIRVLGLKNIEIKNAVAEVLPFDNDLFDLVVSNNGINNVQDIQKSFSEIHRTSKIGSQFVFTMNLDGSMHEFYSVFHDVLLKHNMTKEIQKMKEHIYEKRKPVIEIEKWLTDAGFYINSIITNSFKLRYLNGTAMLNHFLTQVGFIESWFKILPDERAIEIFAVIEEKLNKIAEEEGEIVLTIPYSTFECFKI